MNWVSDVVEADIRSFYDNVEHGWMRKFVEHRIQDKRVLRMIVRFLRAGVIEEGKWSASEEGTPQGGSISPMLANIYLHYVLDLWFKGRYRKTCKGKAELIRYADDFVVCFQHREDAMRFEGELKARLEQFGLEVEPARGGDAQSLLINQVALLGERFYCPLEVILFNHDEIGIVSRKREYAHARIGKRFSQRGHYSR